MNSPAEVIPLRPPTVADYQAAGWQLCAIPSGEKGPTTPGWNERGADTIPDNHNVGLLLSLSNACTLDVDDYDLASAWLAERYVSLQKLLDAPDAVQIISGRPGSAKMLFALSLPLPSKRVLVPWHGKRKVALEFRCASAEGRSLQDVLPPSRHPSGSTYRWGGSGDWRSLPPLPPELFDLWAGLLAEQPAGGEQSGNGTSKLCTLEQLPDLLACLDPDMARDDWRNVGMGCRAEFGDDAFPAWDAWSAGSIEKYHPREMAGQWQSFKDKPGGITFGTVVDMARAAGWQPPPPDVTGMFDAIPPPPAWEPSPGLPGERTPAFPDPFPGVMDEMVGATLPHANKPQPELTVLSVLIGMASCVSGRYYFGNGQRANLFGIGVCETGGGKDWARLVGETVSREGGATRIDAPASGEGLEDMLTDFGAMLMSVDEVGYMLAATNAHNAQSHQVRLKREILRLFSASRTVVHTRVKAGLPQRKINNPCLNILGFTTEGVLGRSMTGNDVASGELPRYLMVFGRKGVPQRRTREKFAIPDGVRRKAKLLVAALGFAKKDEEGLIEIVASPEGDAALDRVMTCFNSQQDSDGTFTKQLMTRAYEKVERIAMVLAVWDNPAAPAIRPDMVEWAHAFVNFSNHSLSLFAEEHMTAAVSIAHAKLIEGIGRRILAGEFVTRNPNELAIIERGRVPWTLLLMRSKLSVKEAEPAVEYLVQTGVVDVIIETFTLPASGGTKPVKTLHFL